MYWTKTYGGRDAFECLVRTILSQNTSDVASQPARDALMDGYGPDDTADDPDLAVALADAEQSHLAETISSAGLYNQKSARIIDIAERVVAEYGSAAGFDQFVREGDPDEVRDTLLAMNGVGPKTARLRPAVRRRPARRLPRRHPRPPHRSPAGRRARGRGPRGRPGSAGSGSPR